jgi:hypothetical protein
MTREGNAVKRADPRTPHDQQREILDQPGYASVHVDDAPTRELFPGARLRTLWRGDNGARAHVLEMDAGATWPSRDVHEPGPEEVFVAAGIFHDGGRAYAAGTFLHAPAGSWHVPATTTGCTLFLFYPEG